MRWSNRWKRQGTSRSVSPDANKENNERCAPSEIYLDRTRRLTFATSLLLIAVLRTSDTLRNFSIVCKRLHGAAIRGRNWAGNNSANPHLLSVPWRAPCPRPYQRVSGS